MERKPFQFTLRRLLLATIWFALAAAGFGNYINNVSPYEHWFSSVVTCSPFLFPALCAGVGVLTGQFNRWAFIGFAIPVVGIPMLLLAAILTQVLMGLCGVGMF